MVARRGHPRRCEVAALALASVLASCHAEPPPKVVAPPPPPAPVARAAPSAGTPLALPAGLVLAGRWRHPSALLAQLEAWSGRELSLDVALRARMGQPEHPFDLEAPIELLVVLDREVEPPALNWAFSIGLDATGPSARAPTGPLDVASPAGLACAEAPALGPSPARLVCAGSDDQLARLLPHATRALPLAPLGDADVALSLRAEALRGVDPSAVRTLVSSWLSNAWGVSAINERFDAQWAGLVEGVTRELGDVTEDLSGASIEFSLRSRAEALELSVLAPAALGRSALGQLIVGSGASGLAPAEFWQAHEASENAGFLWAFEPLPLGRLREPLAVLLGTLLDFRGVPGRLQQQARELVQYMPLPRGPVIHASGRLPAADSRQRRAPWLEALGWQLYSVRGKFSEYQFYVGALVKAFNDPILGPQFGRLLRGSFGPNWAPERMRQRPALHSAELPRGSFALEITFAVPRSNTAAETLGGDVEAAGRTSRAPTLFALFVPDEDGLKITWGADEKFLVSLVASSARPNMSATLAGRAGLGSLHEHRTLAGGFFSLAALEESSQTTLAELGLWDGHAKVVANAPHRGASPIVYTLSQSSDARTLQLEARLARETLEDLLFLIAVQATPP